VGVERLMRSLCTTGQSLLSDAVVRAVVYLGGQNH